MARAPKAVVEPIDAPVAEESTSEAGAIEQALRESAAALKAGDHASHAKMERVLMHLCDLRSALTDVDSQGALGAVKALL